MTNLSSTSQIRLSRLSLPSINVLELDDNSFEKGKISVKFIRNKNSELFDKSIENISNIDFQLIAKKYTFKKLTSQFKTVLKSVDLQNIHEKWDLDLWFTIEFDENIDVKLVYLELKKLKLFKIVEPIYKVHLVSADLSNNSFQFLPNDPRFNEQWGFNNTGQGGGKIGKDIQLKDALDIETGNPNVLVAVHDMGIQLNHPDLQQNIAVGKNYNFVDDNDTIVMGYHGTHVAGTIAAVNNNGIGVTGIAGGNGNINSGIRLMSMQIFKGNKSGGLAESFIYAADNGAAISNNSWAYNTENVYNLSVMDAIDYFIENGGGAVQQGGLVVFAAGNKSRPLSYYPSAYERVICVSATNNRDEKASYSTYGNWVDIAAPGGDYSNGVSSQILSTTFYDGYAGDHGTSMSCPHVSGVEGVTELLKALHQEQQQEQMEVIHLQLLQMLKL